MELFRISCVTCRARLSVRNRSAIGQIVACPKCGSMVEIAPPSGWLDDAPGEQSQVAVRVTDSSLADSPATTASDMAAASSSPAEVNRAPIDQSGPALDQILRKADVASSAGDSTTPAEATESTQQFESASEKLPPEFAGGGGNSYRLIAWTSAATLGGALLVGGWLLSRGSWMAEEAPTPSSEPESSLIAAETRSDATVDAGTAPPSRLATSATETLGDAPEIADAAEAASAEPQLPDLVGAPAATEAAQPLDAPDSESPRVEPNAIVRSAASEPSPAMREASAQSTAPVARNDIDPLGMDPAELDLSILFDPAAELNGRGAAPGQGSGDAEGDSVDAVEDRSARPSQVDAVRVESADADSGEPIDVAGALKRRFPQFEIDQMPLCRFIDFATQLSGLPVSVAPEELRMAGTGPANEVSVNLQDATFEEILATALRPLRLETTRGMGAQLLLQSTRERQFRDVTFAVDDLTSSELSAAQLAQWLKRFTAPSSWKSPQVRLTVDDGRIVSRQHESVQYEALVLLEKLRQALGLPRRTNYPQHLIDEQSSYVEVLDRLDGPATFTYSRFTPLRTIFRDWQEELGVAVLVDWPALAKLQLSPQTRIACGVADESWSNSLDTVLEPLGLDWRVLDGPAVQITTSETTRTEPQVQIYRVPGGSQADARLAADRAMQLAADLNGDAKVDNTAAVAHPSEPIVLLRQPARVHRELTRWLQARGPARTPTAER